MAGIFDVNTKGICIWIHTLFVRDMPQDLFRSSKTVPEKRRRLRQGISTIIYCMTHSSN